MLWAGNLTKRDLDVEPLNLHHIMMNLKVINNTFDIITTPELDSKSNDIKRSI